MKYFISWVFINIFLPLTPFILRIFIMLMSKDGGINTNKILELPELLFFSIYISVVNLNINFDGEKGIFEFVLRFFVVLIIILDCIVLGMIYSGNIGINMYPFSIITSTSRQNNKKGFTINSGTYKQ
jgi:hypothetical protein